MEAPWSPSIADKTNKYIFNPETDITRDDFELLNSPNKRLSKPLYSGIDYDSFEGRQLLFTYIII